jgi:Fe-S-cluster containining protein
MEILHLIEKAGEQGLNIKVLPSKEKPNYFNIVERGKTFTDINDENCVFLKDGLCSIYDERPSVCRMYGTDLVKCWFDEYPPETPAKEIMDLSKEDIEKLMEKVQSLNEQSVIKLFQKHVK